MVLFRVLTVLVHNATRSDVFIVDTSERRIQRGRLSIFNNVGSTPRPASACTNLSPGEPYLNSPDSQAHLNNDGIGNSLDAEQAQAVLNGRAPNPNLQVHRRGPNQNKRTRDGQAVGAGGARQSLGGTGQYLPSLTTHLLSSNAGPFTAATQQPFLSHAGCGTLAAGPLAQWMVQDGHYTRGYVQFVGALIAKIRLPQANNSQFNPMYRTLDLLISALNNIRREMQFFEITATKYGIQMGEEAPNPITRAYLDLFIACSSPSASLLEGMVVLWATEHVRVALKRPTLCDHQVANRKNRYIAPLGSTRPDSPPRSRIQARSRISQPCTRRSSRTGHRRHSPSSSMLASHSWTNSPTRRLAQTARSRWSAASRCSGKSAGLRKDSGRMSTVWAKRTNGIKMVLGMRWATLALEVCLMAWPRRLMGQVDHTVRFVSLLRLLLLSRARCHHSMRSPPVSTRG